MVLSLNITRIALHVLRDGLLNKHVALEEDVWATFNFYYACLLYHVYHTWRSQRLSIRDCGPLLQQTETLARCGQIVRLEIRDKQTNKQTMFLLQVQGREPDRAIREVSVQQLQRGRQAGRQGADIQAQSALQHHCGGSATLCC